MASRLDAFDVGRSGLSEASAYYVSAYYVRCYVGTWACDVALQDLPAESRYYVT
jgi:hypothetical protein